MNQITDRREWYRREYLNSPHWQAFRQRILAERFHECEQCGATEQLDVHHITYKNIGHESPEDVLVLCRRCHEWTHDEQKQPPGPTAADFLSHLHGIDLPEDKLMRLWETSQRFRQNWNCPDYASASSMCFSLLNFGFTDQQALQILKAWRDKHEPDEWECRDDGALHWFVLCQFAAARKQASN